MFCRRARSWISLALDGMLPPDRTLALDKHLERCEECRAHRAELQLGRRLLVATAPRLSDAFEWRLRLRLNQTLQESARAASTPWELATAGSRRWWRDAALGTAAGLALVVAVSLFWLPPRTLSPNIPVAASHTPVVALTATPSGEAPTERQGSSPGTVTGTAGDPSRTTVAPSTWRFWPQDGGLGHDVELRLSGSATRRSQVGPEAWSGASMYDLRTIASLREQNRRLRDALVQAQREVVLLRSQIDTSQGTGEVTPEVPPAP